MRGLPDCMADEELFEWVIELPEGCKTLEEAFEKYPGTDIVDYK